MMMATDDLEYRDELALIANEIAIGFARQKDEEADSRPCPHCNTMLLRGEHEYCKRVLVDTCPKCQGIWLDSGEGKILQRAFDSSSLPTDSLFRSFWKGLRSVFGPS